MQIIEEHDALPVHDPIVVIYGPPGVGKTTLAFTASNPTLLDFDEGANRSVGRKRTVRFANWAEVMEFTKEGGMLESFAPGTLIIDTAGAMLDECIAEFAIKQNGRNGKPGGGVSLQGFGAVKDIFAAFLRRCRQMNVLPVFLCHASEFKDGDDTRLRPKMTGGSYDLLLGKADLVGYIENKGGQPVLNFNPTARHVGKNCVEFPEMKIPHYQSPEFPGFFAGIIDKTRARMAAMTDAQRNALEQVKQVQERVLSCTDYPSLADAYDEILALGTMYQLQVLPVYGKQFASVWRDQNITGAKTPEQLTALVTQAAELEEVVRRPIRDCLKAAAEEMGVRWSKDAGGYVYKEGQQPVTPEPGDEVQGGSELEEALARQQPASEAPAVAPEVPATLMRSAERAVSGASAKPAAATNRPLKLLDTPAKPVSKELPV